MNQDERTKIGEIWVAIASMHGKDIQAMALRLMLDAVNDLPFEKVYGALSNWVKTSKFLRPPTAGEIRETITPMVGDREIANEIARRIELACIKHGHYWSDGIMGDDGFYFQNYDGDKFKTFKEAILSELGDVGWHAICARGGWKQTSKSANDMDEGQFIAQLRDQVSSSLQLKRAGIDVTKITMEPIEHKNDLLRAIGMSDKNKLL